MARARSPNRDKAFEIYKEHNGNIDLVSIAEQLGVSSGTIRGWKAKDKWDDKLNGALQKNTERSVNIKDNKKTKKVTTKKVERMRVNSDDESVELTEKQRLFCIYYVKYKNATKAYQKAYNCDYFTAMSSGSRMLRNVKVNLEIDRMLEEIRNDLKIDNRDLVQKYIDIAFSDITDYLEFGSAAIEGEYGTYIKSYVNLKNSNQVDGTLINEVSQGKDGIKIKLADKMKALDWLDKHIGLASEEQKARIEYLKARTDKLTGDNTEIEDTSETDSDLYGDN